jgi:nitrogen fixation NifU-like protein
MGQFSDTLMDHFQSPRNSRRIANPDLVGLAGVPGNGPYLALYIRLDKTSIVESGFQTHGCGVSIACGSMLTELITHQSVTECHELTPERLSEALDGIPATKLHCPVLAIAALKDALKDFGTPPGIQTPTKGLQTPTLRVIGGSRHHWREHLERGVKPLENRDFVATGCRTPNSFGVHDPDRLSENPGKTAEIALLCPSKIFT